ncbi:MAG: NUDIX hydrolase [Actinomycetes bacterium]
MSNLLSAATVVLVREGSVGIELLLMKRPEQGSFANAWVFPGGRVEVEDVKDEDDSEVDVARRTAVRETFEETGLEINALGLSHVAVWLPPPQAPKRFHTWFFICEAPLGAEVRLPDGELVDHAWMTPAHALASHQNQEIYLMPPTFVSIHGLLQAKTIAEALAAGSAAEIPLYESFIVQVDERPAVVWMGDSEHPSSQGGVGKHRLVMGEFPWIFENCQT